MLQPLVEFPDFLVNSVFHERLVGEVGHPSRLRRKGNALATVTPPPATESPMRITNPPGPHDANTGGGRGKVSPPAKPERVTSGASERNGKWSLPGRIEQKCRSETKGCHKMGELQEVNSVDNSGKLSYYRARWIVMSEEE
jgi:hypothetical protein